MSPRLNRWLGRTVAIAALAMAICLVVIWAANFALTEAVVDVVGSDAIVSGLALLGWIELGLAVVVIGGLAVGAWLHRPVWARGVASVIVGMVLHWGWWLVDRHFDPFRVNLSEIDAGLVDRVQVRFWTTLGIDVLAIAALVLGGVLLLRHTPGGGDFDEPADGGAERAALSDASRL